MLLCSSAALQPLTHQRIQKLDTPPPPPVIQQTTCFSKFCDLSVNYQGLRHIFAVRSFQHNVSELIIVELKVKYDITFVSRMTAVGHHLR